MANYAKSIKISATDKENIAHQVKKLKGEKIAKKVNPDTDSNETISTAQLSFDSRIANLSTLTSQLASHPQYVPNETEITVASLQAYHDELETSSSAVNAAAYQMITARKNRNEELYNGEESAINIIKDIKSYVLSLGDEAKPYYKALVALKFSVNKE